MNIIQRLFSATFRKFYRIIKIVFNSYDKMRFIVRYFKLAMMVGEAAESESADGDIKFNIVLQKMLQAIEDDKNQGEYDIKWLNTLIQFIAIVVS